MTVYPSTIATLTNPNSTDRLNAPSHSGIETAQNTNVIAVQTFLGVEGPSSTVGTLIYDVRSPASNGGGHVQTANTGGTGQTTYTKGDLLLGQSSSVLTKLAIGSSDGLALVVDSTQAAGVRWGVPGNAPVITVYSTPSTVTWIRPSVFNYIVVETIGSGGAGGSGTGTGVAGKVGGGGGAGGYARKVIAAPSILASQNLIIGAVGSVIGGATGGNGSRTSFGTVSILSASGGLGGVTGVAGNGGVGGTGSGGDINGFGQDGSPGVIYINGGNLTPVVGGTGGMSEYGFGRGGNGTDTGNANPGNAGAVIITQY